MQPVFQDPYGSLNPKQSVLEIVAEPLLVHGLIKKTSEARAEVKEFLDLVGMPADTVDRYPHAFSGGQRQRIGIARALALKPEFLVADEPVSALDVSIQAQIVNLMQDLRTELNLTYLFIAHDLSVVRHISDRIAIMYAGQLVEVADKDAVYENPSHPYTQALLSAVPIPDPVIESKRKRVMATGDVPNLIDPAPGCRFASRCPYVQERCRRETPEMQPIGVGHEAACHFVDEIPSIDLASSGR
jgi:peptide/nickel transport system ATP-binding protein